MGLKICQITSVDFTIKKFLLPLIDKLIENGCDVTIICSDGPYVKDLQNSGYKIKTISISRSLNILKHFISLIYLFKYFKSNDFDIVHVHTPVASVLGRIAAKLAGVKYILYTAHGFYFHENMSKMKFNFYFYIEKFLANFTNIIFTQSKEDQKTSIKYKLCNSKKIICIGNGVSLDKFNIDVQSQKMTLRKKFKIPQNIITCVFVGRLVKEKGLEYFFETAFKLLEKKYKIFFIIVGERLNSDHSPAVDQYIKKAKKSFTKSIKFLGMRDDIENILALSDIFCLPSLREGLPRSIIEAMLMGLPVITTNIRGCRELIKHKVNGIICERANEESLYKAFKFFLLDNKKIKLYGINNYNEAILKFDENIVLEKQIKAINKLTTINV